MPHPLIVKAYGDAVGPFGFPMRSDVAKEVDTLFKGLSKECRDYGFKTVEFIPTEKTVGEEGSEDDRTDVSLITNDALDRDGEVMLPKGADWRQFLKNPIVPFAHTYDALPIGKALWVKRMDKKGKDGWLAKTRYSTKPDDWSSDWFADAVWHLVKEGVMPGKSIGFIPTEIDRPSEDEIKARPELVKARYIIRKYLVLEYSIAPVQSNPDALSVSVGKARKKGIIVPDALMNEIGVLVPHEMTAVSEESPTTEKKGATQTQTAQCLPPHVTLEEVGEVVKSRLGPALKSVNIDEIVSECLARKTGKV